MSERRQMKLRGVEALMREARERFRRARSKPEEEAVTADFLERLEALPPYLLTEWTAAHGLTNRKLTVFTDSDTNDDEPGGWFWLIRPGDGRDKTGSDRAFPTVAEAKADALGAYSGRRVPKTRPKPSEPRSRSCARSAHDHREGFQPLRKDKPNDQDDKQQHERTVHGASRQLR